MYNCLLKIILASYMKLSNSVQINDIRPEYLKP